MGGQVPAQRPQRFVKIASTGTGLFGDPVEHQIGPRRAVPAGREFFALLARHHDLNPVASGKGGKAEQLCDQFCAL